MNKNQDGIAHILLFFLVVVIMGVVGFAAYRVGTNKKSEQPGTQQQAGTGAVFETGGSGCTPGAPVAEAKDAFTNAPFKFEQVKFITNGKDTNDPRFVYPWVKTASTDRVEIFAPATGDLYMIRHKVYEIDGKKGNDYDIFFAVDCKTVYRFNHISNPRDDIKATYPAGDLPSGDYANGGLDIPERVKPTKVISVKAGESLGYTTGTPTARNFDFAVGVSTSKEGDKLAVCPPTVFTEPIKSQMSALFGPKTAGAPQAGFACDVEARKF